MLCHPSLATLNYNPKLLIASYKRSHFLDTYQSHQIRFSPASILHLNSPILSCIYFFSFLDLYGSQRKPVPISFNCAKSCPSSLLLESHFFLGGPYLSPKRASSFSFHPTTLSSRLLKRQHNGLSRVKQECLLMAREHRNCEWQVAQHCCQARPASCSAFIALPAATHSWPRACSRTTPFAPCAHTAWRLTFTWLPSSTHNSFFCQDCSLHLSACGSYHVTYHDLPYSPEPLILVVQSFI